MESTLFFHLSSFDSRAFQDTIKTMTREYIAHLPIRQYELDARGELPNSALQRLFQETATQGSADAGYGVEWYSTHNSVWVIYQMTLEHARPIRYGDELAITTWVSDFQRVRSHREYLARHARTNEIVARGRAYWAHLNRATLMPTRIPVDLFEQFAPNGVSALPRIAPRIYPAPRLGFDEFHTTRRVYRYEADEMQHVNNAIYIDWLEEALADAAMMFFPAQNDRRLSVYRHDIEYTRSAVPGDQVEISVRLVGAGQTTSAWDLKIIRRDEILIKDHITALWVNDAGKPIRCKI